MNFNSCLPPLYFSVICSLGFRDDFAYLQQMKLDCFLHASSWLRRFCYHCISVITVPEFLLVLLFHSSFNFQLHAVSVSFLLSPLTPFFSSPSSPQIFHIDLSPLCITILSIYHPSLSLCLHIHSLFSHSFFLLFLVPLFTPTYRLLSFIHPLLISSPPLSLPPPSTYPIILIGCSKCVISAVALSIRQHCISALSLCAHSCLFLRWTH